MLRHQPLAQPPTLLPALAAVERERGGDGRQPRLGIRRLVQPHHHRDGVDDLVGARADECEGGRGGRRQARTDETTPEAEARHASLLAVGEREHEQVDRRAPRLPEVIVVAQPVLGLPAVVPHREGAAVELVLPHIDAASARRRRARRVGRRPLQRERVREAAAQRRRQRRLARALVAAEVELERRRGHHVAQ